MTILSDRTIRTFIQQKKLIPNGDVQSAKHCSYEFKAGRVVYGGIVPPSQQVTSIDLSSIPAQTATIQPSGIAWVRSREVVKIPPNFVGMWVQTNSLSRRGLLLLNSTLVEPGYEGHLSAHFVNLSSSAVTLSSSTTIAKLIFVQLDADAAELIDSTPFRNYDARIDELAATSDPSFLRIRELVPDLSKKSDETVAEAKKQIEDLAKNVLEEAKESLGDLKKETFLKVGGGVIAGLLLTLGFLAYMIPKLRSIDLESADRITRIVVEQNRQLADKDSQLSEHLKKLQTDLDDLRQRAPRDAVMAPEKKALK